jgi:trans-aconitate methyltransferase
MHNAHVNVFASNTPEYHTAFSTFLRHTDQKDKAIHWLTRQVDALDRRALMIDAGAATGKLTAWFIERFTSVVAIEPNPSLQAALRASCPTASVHTTGITDCSFPDTADFVLCSHVFYHIPKPAWSANVTRLMSWLAPKGVLAIALQNPNSDCSQMTAHFLGARFDLAELASTAVKLGANFDVSLEAVKADIKTADRTTACAVAEFMLNVAPMPSPPLWSDLERYVESRFRRAEGGYQFSCDQDFLRIRRLA